MELSRYKASTYLIISAILLSILHKVDKEFYYYIELSGIIIGMLLVGIPHGALDHIVKNNDIETRISTRFISRYLANSFCFLILWILSPLVSLIIFISYSAFHFGQTDMEAWNSEKNSYLKSFIWGLSILLILLTGHQNETNFVLSNMKVFVLPLDENNGKLVSYIVGLISLGWALWERHLKMALSICALIISTELPLMSAFGLYFIGQHSLNGWNHLKESLKVSHYELFKKSIPFTLAASTLFLLLFYFANVGYLTSFSNDWITIFFVFIACISLPHVLVMKKYYSSSF